VPQTRHSTPMYCGASLDGAGFVVAMKAVAWSPDA
jgi:hypothetical protein